MAPDPRLRVISTPVERIDAEIHRLLDDMLETMYEAPGIGLAAVQVGVPKRIVDHLGLRGIAHLELGPPFRARSPDRRPW